MNNPILPAASILVVDDVPENLKLMSGILKERGYKVRAVPSGPLALETARLIPPELILLDINMPEMNGYEVCQRLKADKALADIPIIFLSALNETEDKVNGFRAGGVDYITKPFQVEEVYARVECQLNLQQLRKNLEQRNNELTQTNRHLRESEALRDNLIHMVIHDMRSPLTAQIGFLDTLLSQPSDSPGNAERTWLQASYAIALKLTNMLNSLLDISRMEAGKMPIRRKRNNLNKLTRLVLAFYQPLIGERQVAIESPHPSLHADCDAALVQRVLENLLGNALKFTAETGAICISIAQCGETARISVTDDGPGIAPVHHKTVFMKFGQAGTPQKKHSTGIGLAFCKMAIEAQGGQIGVNSELGKGSTFWFTLPINPAEK